MRRTCRYLFLGAAFLVLTPFHTAAQEAETSPVVIGWIPPRTAVMVFDSPSLRGNLDTCLLVSFSLPDYDFRCSPPQPGPAEGLTLADSSMWVTMFNATHQRVATLVTPAANRAEMWAACVRALDTPGSVGWTCQPGSGS